MNPLSRWYAATTPGQRRILKMGVYVCIYILIFQATMLAIWIHYATDEQMTTDWIIMRVTLSNIDAFGTAAMFVFLHEYFANAGKMDRVQAEMRAGADKPKELKGEVQAMKVEGADLNG